LNLLAESFGVLVLYHPEQLDPKALYRKLGLSGALHGQNIMETVKGIRYSSECTGILIPETEF
jgi:hypothetical protein